MWGKKANFVIVLKRTCKDVQLPHFPDFGNDSPYLFTPMYEASFKGTKR